MDSKTTDARISRTKLKERVKITRCESRMARATEKVHSAMRTASLTAPASVDNNALAQLLLVPTLAGAGVAKNAAKVTAITSVVGLESFLNPIALRLRHVAKQPKYGLNSNESSSCGFKPKNFKKINSSWPSWIVLNDRRPTLGFVLGVIIKRQASPLIFDEVWEHQEVQGSGLHEDHQMLRNFPSFSRLPLHEDLDKKQHFWNLVGRADHSGEKFSHAELKHKNCDKIPSEIAPNLPTKKSEEKD